MLECSVNEHKPMHTGPAGLSRQPSKLLRINRSILGHNACMETIVFLDAHGLTGTIHGMRVMADVFGTRPLGIIALPTNKYEMEDFLHGESLEMLLRYREHVCRVATVLLSQKARERMTMQFPHRPCPPSIHSPTMKRNLLPSEPL
ncbi:hypothetical protein BGZ98_002783 [Dissophora globulifera]|nr:hypothetical protein BGZ98_002783 [Dissophora globulifera]